MKVVHCLKCDTRMIHYATGTGGLSYRCPNCDITLTTWNPVPNRHKSQIAREADSRYPHFIDQPAEAWSEDGF